MITAIEIENFKGIGERQRIDLIGITLLFGPNSAGKSTIFQAVDYFRSVIETNSPNGRATSSRALQFNDVVHNHDLEKTIRIRIETLHTRLGPGMRSVTDVLTAAYPSLKHWIDQSDHAGWLPHGEDTHGLYVEVGIARQGQHAAEITELSVGWGAIRFCSVKRYRANSFGIGDLNLNHPVIAAPQGSRFENLEALYKGVLAETRDYCKGLWPDVFDTEEDFEAAISRCFASYDLPGALRSADFGFSSLPFELAGYFDEFVDCEPDCHAAMRFLIRYMLFASLAVVREELRYCLHLGPIRQKPGKGFEPFDYAGVPEPISEMMLHERTRTGLSAWEGLHHNYSHHSFYKSFNSWLSSESRLDTGYEMVRRVHRQISEEEISDFTSQSSTFTSKEVKDFLENSPTSTEIFLRHVVSGVLLKPDEVGEGITQLVPVIAFLLGEPPSCTAFIEQPELHLNPKQQAELGDLLIESTRLLRWVCVETHSEHLMLRLLRRVKEKKPRRLVLPLDDAFDDLESKLGIPLPGISQRQRSDSEGFTNEDLSVYYVDNIDGITHFTQMEVDDEGEFLCPWPDNFFDQSFMERFP